ncbi:MAG: CocE/NonD family hydrolase [Anaerolineae bacterium]|jgi:hypothetical protein|nr:CocE/NonD family hydrolase [Anaerolineae bacterium]
MQKRRWLALFLGLLALLLVLLRRYLVARRRHQRPRYRVQVVRGLACTTDDGARLVADHYFPDTLERCPTLIIRTPYGRNWRAGLFGAQVEWCARGFAERGYDVLVQDTRGRFDSTGTFEPYVSERADGLATLRWLERQPWFSGAAAMWGPSYLGIVQWAMADAPALQALFPMISTSRLYDIVFPDGAFDLGLMLRWIAFLLSGDKPRHRTLLFGGGILLDVEWMIRRGLNTLPVTQSDVALTGQPVDYYHRWLEQVRPDDPLWHETFKPIDPATVTAPVHLTGGWYDLFLRGLLQDYAALKAAGQQPYLTIGGWHHFSHLFLMTRSLDDALNWFDAHLKGQTHRLRPLPVRLYIMGADEWRDYPAYPPPSTPLYLYPGGGGQLLPQPDASPPDHYRYDPAHPTPIVGGTQFHVFAGPWDNRRLERRRDVLTYTGPVLSAPLEIIGPVRLQLYVCSSLEHTDFYGRLCDVQPDGRAINVCEGLLRLAPGSGERQPDGSLKIDIDLWATAYRFRAGHRLRLLVASGAHPRWSRHPGTPDPLHSTRLLAADQTIFHDRQHPSALIVPQV